MAAKTFIGSNQVKKVYLGGMEIKKIYVGQNLVYQNKVEPIIRDLTSGYFTVPSGYTQCECRILVSTEGSYSAGYFGINGTLVMEVGDVSFADATERFPVAGGYVLDGHYSGSGVTITITLT